MNAGFLGFAVLCIITVTWWTVKTKYGGRAFFLSAVQGIAGLFAVNLAGALTGVFISVNWYTLCSYIILGLPGVIGTLTVNFILR